MTAAQASRAHCFRLFPPTVLTCKQVTEYNVSASLKLSLSLDADYGGDIDAMLGAFELAFVLFITLSSAPAFEHWKHVVHLVSASASVSPPTPPTPV